ncbi:MAG TPA: phospholipase D-like domain-containing protein [bacterium]|nr:phospholipase D-like domain-containing protein [bacterium]HQI48268.1 phospholipase D-like domain-containing protein [bacterium]HQJ66000.1 phospholipase D-like domain-containing protein [bacterium]
MRARAKKNGLTLQAYAGTTGVLLAMNTSSARRKGLLGFAIEREGPASGRVRWLQGLLRFPGETADLNTPVDSNLGPIQKYRWSDYAVYPATPYRYQVYGVYGRPGKLRYIEGPEVSLTTESLQQGTHQIIFNRAAAASQAYARRFGNVNPDDPGQEAARKWLSRGLHERLLAFFDQALDASWALDVAVYEVELPEVTAALAQALARGARVRIVYHARTADPQTTLNEQTLEPLPGYVKASRLTSAIFHHKFCVLSRIQGDGSCAPQAVLTGSTNFTANAVYRQANVLHIMEDATIAGRYLELFDKLFAGTPPGDTRTYINRVNPAVGGLSPQVLFSPRSHLTDLAEVIEIIQRAQRDLVFCTAFNLLDGIEEALLGEEESHVIRYGLQNSKSRITGTHRHARFVTPAFLNKGLEGFLRESIAGQEGNILIHLKTIITDFSSEEPTIITGSNNFSRSASASNDENLLIVSRETAVADIYVTEMMRLYDHYRFRYNTKATGGRGPAGRLVLAPNDHWTDRYYAPQSLEYFERMRFSRTAEA